MKKKFIINSEKNIVIAEMIDIPKSIVKETEEKTSKMTSFLVNEIFQKLTMSKSSNPLYKAVAKCDNRDDFDEKIGIEIAATKSDLKYHIAMRKKYMRVLKVLRKACDEIESLAVYHQKKVRNIEDDIKRCFIDKDLSGK